MAKHVIRLICIQQLLDVYQSLPKQVVDAHEDKVELTNTTNTMFKSILTLGHKTVSEARRRSERSFVVLGPK